MKVNFLLLEITADNSKSECNNLKITKVNLIFDYDEFGEAKPANNFNLGVSWHPQLLVNKKKPDQNRKNCTQFNI